MVEVLAIIPARGGSKSIPRKNIKMLAGKPMVYYSIEACKRSKYVTQFVVSTEDKEIKDISMLYGAQVVDRPEELALDETKTAPVMAHALSVLEKNGYKPDYVLLIQPTTPFRPNGFIDAAFEYFLANLDYDSCFSVFDRGISHGLWRKGHDGKFEPLYDAHNRPRRQDLEKHYNLFCENGAFYAVKYETFKKYQDFVGVNPCVFLTDINFDVDEPGDFLAAEELIRKNQIS